MMRLLRPPASLSLLRSRTGLAILASRATHALHPLIGIFLRSFHSHSTHYARETIAEICSMRALRFAVPAARKPRVAFHGHPCDACVAPLVTAPMSQTGS
jgi:hypothetical protein